MNVPYGISSVIVSPFFRSSMFRNGAEKVVRWPAMPTVEPLPGNDVLP